MSTHQRVRRNASPGSSKQGPMKAILPVSLMRQAPSPTKSNQKTNSNKTNVTPPISNSPTWFTDSSTPRLKSSSRRSPDNRISPERRSLGSPCFIKEKSRTLNNRSSANANYGASVASPVIRRTASLDTIYLSGQWPRDQGSTFRSYCGHLMVDKATQTPEEWDDFEKKKTPKKICGTSDYQLEKFIRQRLQRTKEAAVGTHNYHLHTSPVQGDHSAISINNTTAAAINTNSSRAVPIPIPPTAKTSIPRMRSSVEGLNQEIEKLVFKEVANSDENYNNDRDLTPDGHRAPIADMFLSGKDSVQQSSSNNNSTSTSHTDADTQTPYSLTNSRGSRIAGGLTLNEENNSSSNSSSGTGSRCQSTSPDGGIIMPGLPGLSCWENSSSASQYTSMGNHGIKETKSLMDIHGKSASPDFDTSTQTKLGTSPHINKFLEREPPDGCEKVCVEENKQCIVTASPLFCPVKPSMNFILKPSLGSAFYPLDQSHFSKISDRDTASSAHVAISHS